MARGKSSKLKPFEKLLTIMVSGNPVTIEEIENRMISDITVESDNHSFIAGNNFLSSN
jgi:hypothetical protein